MITSHQLSISNLHVSAHEREIIKGVDLKLKSREFHVVMGPNGSGKSTLTYALMGHPSYEVTQGTLRLDTKNLKGLEAHERAQQGILLAFQNPIAVPGVTFSSLLRAAYTEIHGKDSMSIKEFHTHLHDNAEKLHLNKDFLRRAINDGFSGGEKKKAEMLQLLVLKPKFAIFDEIDTGLDVDALKIVAHGIDLLQKQGTGILLITHYQRILNYLQPQYVHVMKEGTIVKEGDAALARLIEDKGYANI